MQVYSVLTSYTRANSSGRAYYFPVDVIAEDETAARRDAEKMLRAFFRGSGREVIAMRVYGVAPSGSYDEFVGKYVGQFIDEALCRKQGN